MITNISLSTVSYPGSFQQTLFKRPVKLNFSSSESTDCRCLKPSSQDNYVSNNSKTTPDLKLTKKEKILENLKNSFSYLAGTGFFLLAASATTSTEAIATSTLSQVFGIAGVLALAGACILYFIGNNVKKDKNTCH